ncbi:Riboflavin kinase, partial [Tetrabaena socialis]
WADAPLLPGALRLVRHLAASGVAFAVATSTPRATFQAKMSEKEELRGLLAGRQGAVVVCGDEVVHGKPRPDVFLEAARQLGVAAADCLVLEDAPSGVQNNNNYETTDDGLLATYVRELPCLKPNRTNVDPAVVAAALSEAVTGIYAGWARVGARPEVHKTVLSIGWNPFFGNKEKTLEPWILAHFDKPFYGEQLSLVIVGYVRPEANFTSLEALVARIHLDGQVSREALELPPLSGFRGDPFLTEEQPAAAAGEGQGQGAHPAAGNTQL